MSGQAFVTITSICDVKVSKLDYHNHSFTMEFYGTSTKGKSRKVRVVMQPWMYEHFAREFAKVPVELHKIAQEMQRALCEVHP